jgi:hypothetical protein
MGLSDEPSDPFDDCATVWDLTARLCERLAAQLDAAGCIVSRVIGDVLVQVAEHAPDGRTFQLGRGFLVSQFPATAEVLTGSEPRAVSLEDASADDPEAAVLRDLAVRAVLMLRLGQGATAWGLVEVYRIDPPGYTAAEMAGASAVVHQAEGRLQAILDARRRG